MRNAILILASLAPAVRCGLAQTAAASTPAICCELSVHQATPAGTSVAVTITNKGTDPIIWWRGLSEESFTVRGILSSSGAEPPLTRFGKTLRQGKTPIGDYFPSERLVLEPGQSHSNAIDLLAIWELREGTYQVWVSTTVYVNEKPVLISGQARVVVPSGGAGDSGCMKTGL